MTDQTIFPNAPITEALLDIQVTLPPEVDLATLATFQEAVKDRFPVRREQSLYEFGLQTNTNNGPEILAPTGGLIGYLFDSPDEKKVVQARLNGYTFSKFKPYENWNVFRDEAKELWQHYVTIARPTSVTRIALRYINRVELPLPLNDFKDYLLTAPEIAPGIPQYLTSFFMRLVIPHPEAEAIAIVTEVLEPIIQHQETVPILFDTDVFQARNYAPQEESIWEMFETLRRFKDTLFFNSMTDAAKRLFQ